MKKQKLYVLEAATIPEGLSEIEKRKSCRHILFFSPCDVLFRDVAPAVSADRSSSALVVDVELNVRAFAFSVPRVSAFFN